MKIHLFILSILLISLTSAAPNLEIEKISKGSLIISELNNPAVYTFVIDNKGAPEFFEIYSLLSVSIWPKGKFELPYGITEIEVRAFPDSELRRNLGVLRFSYEISGEQSGIFKDTMLTTVVPLKSVLEITSEPISSTDKDAAIIIKNKENTYIENLEIELDSPFFNSIEKISLTPKEETTISIPITKNLLGIQAGTYIVNTKAKTLKGDVAMVGSINFEERVGSSLTSSSSGFIIRKTILSRTNEGNINSKITMELKKDIVSRLFTLFSKEPLSVERSPLFVTYTWEQAIEPGDALVVETTTNYTIPFIILLLIITIGALVYLYSRKSISLVKKVSFVKTKSGEFALKVNFHVKARKTLRDIQIIDMLPQMTKLYENFGKKPDKIDERTKRLFWNIPHLSKGEKRIFSYIIYSKLNIVGRFELPHALATYEQNGKTREVLSNKAYFVRGESG